MTEERQHVVRVSSRRAKLTPAPGATDEPDADESVAAEPATSGGPNDERMMREVPPHY